MDEYTKHNNPFSHSTCIMSPFKRFFIRQRWPMLFNATCNNDIYIFQDVLIKYQFIVFLFCYYIIFVFLYMIIGISTIAYQYYTYLHLQYQNSFCTYCILMGVDRLVFCIGFNIEVQLNTCTHDYCN